MNIQARVALDKQAHPERYCPVQGCLWKIVKLDHETQTYYQAPNCLEGRCPRHRLPRHQGLEALKASIRPAKVLSGMRGEAMTLERKLEISPAYDKRPEYGIHGVEMRWMVCGGRGVIQFLLFTNWHLKHVQAELDAKIHVTDSKYTHLSCHPLPADIGYHSYIPMYEGQTVLTENCPYLGGKPCYYDGSGLNAQRFYEILVERGGEPLWVALEQEYVERFESVEVQP